MVNKPFPELVSIAELMRGFNRPWAFCGGWAIDLFVGRRTRTHKDVDIAVLRPDQLAVQEYLAGRGWTLEIAYAGELTPWQAGAYIELPRHGVWCKNPRYNPDFLEVLLNETDGTRFLFRRDQSITLALDRALLRASGLPVLAPEIALLYKSANSTLEENAADFRSALPALDAERRAWLKAGLERLSLGHPWIVDL
jgi:hypothetical protein